MTDTSEKIATHPYETWERATKAADRVHAAAKALIGELRIAESYGVMMAVTITEPGGDDYQRGPYPFCDMEFHTVLNHANATLRAKP